MFRPTQRVEGAHRDGIWSVTWSKDLLSTGSLDGVTKLWKGDFSLVGSTAEQRLGITSVVFANNNESVLSCCQDSIIRLYSTTGLKEYAHIDPGHLEALSISYSQKKEFIAGGTHQGKINFWSVNDQTRLFTLEGSSNDKFFMSTCFNCDGDKIAASSMKGDVLIFDLQTSQIIHRLDAHGLPIRKVMFSPDGNLIYTASDDRHVSVFDSNSGNIINSFSHTGMAFSIDVSPDHRHFVVGCADHTVVLWDLGMQRQEQTFDSQHTDQVWGVAFNETGNKFVSVGDDALLQMYERSS